jgi:hypothetical protein
MPSAAKQQPQTFQQPKCVTSSAAAALVCMPCLRPWHSPPSWLLPHIAAGKHMQQCIVWPAAQLSHCSSHCAGQAGPPAAWHVGTAPTCVPTSHVNGLLPCCISKEPASGLPLLGGAWNVTRQDSSCRFVEAQHLQQVQRGSHTVLCPHLLSFASGTGQQWQEYSYQQLACGCRAVGTWCACSVVAQVCMQLEPARCTGLVDTVLLMLCNILSLCGVADCRLFDRMCKAAAVLWCLSLRACFLCILSWPCTRMCWVKAAHRYHLCSCRALQGCIQHGCTSADGLFVRCMADHCCVPQRVGWFVLFATELKSLCSSLSTARTSMSFRMIPSSSTVAVATSSPWCLCSQLSPSHILSITHRQLNRNPVPATTTLGAGRRRPCSCRDVLFTHHHASCRSDATIMQKNSSLAQTESRDHQNVQALCKSPSAWFIPASCLYQRPTQSCAGY